MFVSHSLDLPRILFRLAVDHAGSEVGDALFAAVMLCVALLVYVCCRWLELTREIMMWRSAQRRLRRNKYELDAAVDHMPQGLVMFDDAARLILCNSRYIKMYGLTREAAARGRTLESIIEHRIKSAGLKADARQLAKAVEDMVRAGKPRRLASDLADGRSIDIITMPLPGGGWVATHEDITERRRAERHLRYIEKLLLSVIDNVPGVVTMKDARSLKYLFVNKAGERHFGLPRSRMIGYAAHDLFSTDVADLFVKADREALASGMELFVHEYPVATADGTRRAVSERRLPIRDDNGNMQCLLSLIENATKAEQIAVA